MATHLTYVIFCIAPTALSISMVLGSIEEMTYQVVGPRNFSSHAGMWGGGGGGKPKSCLKEEGVLGPQGLEG
jgi:hypothetical protein